MANVIEQMEITKKAYQLFYAEDSLYHHVFEGEHVWEEANHTLWGDREWHLCF